MDYYQYIKSPAWQGIAESIKKRDGYKCRLCNSGLDLDVHHRTYDILGNERNHTTDLITLCRRCHALFHGKMSEPSKEKKEPSKPTQTPANGKVEKWTGAKLKGNKEYHERAEQRRAEFEKEWGGVNKRIVLDEELIDLCLTFSCGYGRGQKEILGSQLDQKNGWKRRMVGETHKTHDILKVFAYTSRREKGQIAAGRTCNV